MCIRDRSNLQAQAEASAAEREAKISNMKAEANARKADRLSGIAAAKAEAKAAGTQGNAGE